MKYPVNVGDKFNRLTVTSAGPATKSYGRRWHCRCDCGAAVLVESRALATGSTKSCGCLRREMQDDLRARRVVSSVEGVCMHGHKTRTRRIWTNMMTRCFNEKTKNYARYGGRGITVCERWQSFANFYADMGAAPPKTSIDRISNDGDYEPGNCRWATPVEQGRNTSANRLLTHEGKTMPVAAWSELRGWRPHVIGNRLRYGWPVERALTEPIHEAFGYRRGPKALTP